jgi:signal transduction histidine kinase
VELIKRTDLNQVVKTAIENQAQQQPVAQLHEPEQQYYVLAESDRLTSVLQHLIQNAQDATADDGRIAISVKDAGNDCIVEIEDNGIGMDRDFIQYRLFKPFDTTKGNAGMGIGVYESRETLRSFGGDMQVSSRVGEGTTISVILRKYSERVLTAEVS